MYKKRAVLMGVPKSNEKAISEVLFAVKKSLALSVDESEGQERWLES
jgi:hypothetical protein